MKERISNLVGDYTTPSFEALTDKQVLARIAQHRIEEFQDYDIPMIIPLKRKMYMVHQWMVENMIIFRYHLFVSQKGVWKKARIS